MKEFIKKMLHLGAELQKADDAFHCSMIINDAETLYKNEIEALTIQRVSQRSELLKVLSKRIAKTYELNEVGVLKHMEDELKNL